MPSKKQYNLVHNDEYDTRIPLHSEEAFHRGIVFHAKVKIGIGDGEEDEEGKKTSDEGCREWFAR